MAIQLSNLPENCVANVISLTTPRDACRITTVSTLFHSAADSDIVWGCFLPPDHLAIIAESDEETQSQLLTAHHQKKHLFMHLADSPILVDSGRKSFFVEKASGKKCFMISAKDCTIVWAEADTPMYWEWVPFSDSRSFPTYSFFWDNLQVPFHTMMFAEVAKLHLVCWLEISLRIDASLLSPKTVYKPYLVFKLTDGITGLEHTPVETSVGMSDGVKNTNIICLAPEDDIRRPMQKIRINEREVQYPKRRADGWLEVELGEVFMDGGGDSSDFLEVLLEEVKQGTEKRGLVVEGIEFRPKA